MKPCAGWNLVIAGDEAIDPVKRTRYLGQCSCRTHRECLRRRLVAPLSGKIPAENRGPIRFRACKGAKPCLVKEGAGDAVLRLNGRQKFPGAASRCEMASKRQELRSHAKASIPDPDIESFKPIFLSLPHSMEACHSASA